MAAVNKDRSTCMSKEIQQEERRDNKEINENLKSCNDVGENANKNSDDVVSPLEKDGSYEFPVSAHTRKRSVLKREDRVRTPSSLQKRVSFSSGPSDRRVSNGKFNFHIAWLDQRRVLPSSLIGNVKKGRAA